MCKLTHISLARNIKDGKNIPDSPKNENGLIQMIRIGKSIGHISVKVSCTFFISPRIGFKLLNSDLWIPPGPFKYDQFISIAMHCG